MGCVCSVSWFSSVAASPHCFSLAGYDQGMCIHIIQAVHANAALSLTIYYTATYELVLQCSKLLWGPRFTLPGWFGSLEGK